MLRKDLSDYTRAELQRHIESTLWMYISILSGLAAGLAYFIYDPHPQDSLIAGIIIAVVVWKTIAEKPYSEGATEEEEN